MKVLALKEQILNGIKVRPGTIMGVSKRHAAKLIREGLARPVEESKKFSQDRIANFH